ncbi:MAG: CPBP family intramembrane metalloprotease [Anaerolineales bacterium]|nr:CPBP family intramembrane metalloprotease [Anaerolineales bacterium]
MSTTDNFEQPAAQELKINPSKSGVRLSLQKPSAWIGSMSQDAKIAWLYLIALILAESLATTIAPVFGLVLHALLLLAVIVHAALFSDTHQRRFLTAFALVPLIRLMSLMMPLPNYPFIYWYALVGAPLLLAVYVTQNSLELRMPDVGLNGRLPLIQLLVGATGIGLGYLEYIILRPNPLAPSMALSDIWVPAIILIVFTGLLEEWLFRGLLQLTAFQSIGRFGLLFVAVVFAVMHLGYHSFWDIVFVFSVAVYFGWVTMRTGSIVGVTIAHSLTNIGLFLIFPFLVGG